MDSRIVVGRRGFPPVTEAVGKFVRSVVQRRREIVSFRISLEAIGQKEDWRRGWGLGGGVRRERGAMPGQTLRIAERAL
jgi:hypothetical protein